ncbi:formylglycine-generating enzyme family protein [Leptothoe spongobia TAU-MAC 1115]|uniref:Formylglycine-generating enzyme family protein n=2 Tax=Leptothoe TaxID=2651725 RepID=A0A947DN16_9CYAN|nr:formylglycine-generating enzyme family protein [Leptothoe spongobia TAU-MAC 1115]
MMLIPGGSFMMGSPEGELERLDSESPQHEVTVSQFFMAKYPVTQAQWRAVVEEMPKVNQDLKPEPSEFKGVGEASRDENRNPVEQVSWHDAVEFCDRLTIHTNRQYRLPTEAEWEYACRAETTTPFHFGETLSTEIANYNGASENNGAYGPGERGEYRQQTTPVDHFKGANAYGLHDMHGNVWEWCQDHWHNSYKDAPTDGRAWLTDDEKAERILRGGSWADYPRDCRSAYRTYFTPANRDDTLGFRVVCSAPRILP